MVRKGFVFDLDGVICDTAKYHYIAWKCLGDKLDIPIDEAFNEELKGISRMDSLEKILAKAGKENDFSQEEKILLATEKNEIYVNLLEELTPQDLLPGVLPFLQEASKLGIRCSIASASLNAPVILEKLQVLSYFDTIVDPQTLKKGKPDPEIFEKAAASIDVLPSEAVGFEDAVAGIEGIKKAGMYSVGIGDASILKQADICVKTLAEINITTLLEV